MINIMLYIYNVCLYIRWEQTRWKQRENEYESTWNLTVAQKINLIFN